MTGENRPTSASLSTMWAVKNYPDLNDFFTVTHEIGFGLVELNHQVDSAMLSRVRLDHQRISSVHEPCPADISVKELVERDWLISATDEGSRYQGVNAVKKSIDLAQRVEAPVVVVHCGSIPFRQDDESQLRRLFSAGMTHSDEFKRVKVHFTQARDALIRPRFEAVKRSLDELLKYADKRQVRLGLENRYHFMDIPIPDEMEELLSRADASRLGFIYDVGHDQALTRLGFFEHGEWLRRFAGRMFGCHLHDVIGLTDHFAPGLGEIDFNAIAPLLPNSAFRTIEILPGNTLAQLIDGVSNLAQVGCIDYL